jgi:hypothetical protein
MSPTKLSQNITGWSLRLNILERRRNQRPSVDWAARLRQVDEALAVTTFLTVKARVVSQADLAAMAGVARENVSRVLSEWRRRKFVTGSSRRYCLNNLAALKREMKAGPLSGRPIFGQPFGPGIRRGIGQSSLTYTIRLAASVGALCTAFSPRR